jgi:hypothetical protein
MREYNGWLFGPQLVELIHGGIFQACDGTAGPVGFDAFYF